MIQHLYHFIYTQQLNLKHFQPLILERSITRHCAKSWDLMALAPLLQEESINGCLYSIF